MSTRALIPVKPTAASFRPLAPAHFAVLQRRATDGAIHSIAPPAAHEALRLPNQPLDMPGRKQMARGFGHYFDELPIHPEKHADQGRQKSNVTSFAARNFPSRLLLDVNLDGSKSHLKRSMLSDQGKPKASQSQAGNTIKLVQAGGGAKSGAPGTSANASPCKFTITYNVTQSECPEGYCGAGLRATPTGICGSGSGCPPLAGLQVTEAVKSDQGCSPGDPETGGGCKIQAAPGQPPTCGKFPVGCSDQYLLCMDPRNVHGQCIEKFHQQIAVDGALAEEHDITFALSKPNGHCSGTVKRT